MTRNARLLLGSLFLLATHAAEAGEMETWRITAEPIVLPALEVGRAGALSALMVTPAPEGMPGEGLIVLNAGDYALYHVPWRGSPVRLPGPMDSPGQDAWNQPPPFALDTFGNRLVVTRGSGYAVFTARGGSLDGTEPSPLPDAATVEQEILWQGDRFFALGTPVMVPEGEAPRWASSAWRRSHGRPECGLYTVDLRAPRPSHTPILCDPLFDSPTGRILRGGALVPSLDGKVVFAVAAARPFLTLVGSEGNVIADIRYLPPGETAPHYNAEDEQAQYRSRQAAMEVRDRFPAFLGLLRWRDQVALLFRHNQGGRTRFTADLFDAKGKRLADDLPILVPEGGAGAHLMPINLADGRCLVIFREMQFSPGGPPSITRQQVLELKLETAPAVPATASLRFELLDALSSEPLTSARATLNHGKETVEKTLASGNGRYAVPLPQGPGDVRLTLAANGFAPVHFTLANQDAELGAIYLDPGFTVEGTLLHAATGEALVGARVRAVRRHPWGSLAAARLGHVNETGTDARGSFRLGGLEAGNVCLAIEHPGIAPRTVAIPRLDEDRRHELGTLALGTGVPVEGRVVGADEEPRGGVVVELRAGPWRNPCSRQRTVTDEEGQFRFPRVATGDYKVAVFQQQSIAAVEPVRVVDRPVSLGDLRVHEQRFEGRVHLAGVSAPSGTLTLELAGSGGFDPPPVFFAAASGGQELISDLTPRVAAAVEDGQFSTVGFLPPGEVIATYQPQPADGGTVAAAAYRVPLPVADTTSTVHIDLDFDGEAVTGIVLGPRGEPLAGASVRLMQDAVAIRATISNAEAGFTLPQVPPGQYRIEGRLDDFEGSLPASSGETRARLVLTPQRPRRIEFAVTARTGEPASGTVVSLSDGLYTHVFQTTDPDGHATFLGLEPGRYHPVLLHGGALIPGPPIDLTANPGTAIQRPLVIPEVHPVVLVLDGAHHDQADLSPANGVSVAPLLAYLGLDLHLDPDGRLELPPLAVGRWFLELPRRQQRFPFDVGGEARVIELR